MGEYTSEIMCPLSHHLGKRNPFFAQHHSVFMIPTLQHEPSKSNYCLSWIAHLAIQENRDGIGPDDVFVPLVR